MKKLMISMAAAMLVTVSMANASTISSTPSIAVVTTQEKTEVKPEDLPDAVKATLAAAPYNEWKVEKAFLVPGENDTHHFEINLSNGEESAKVKLDSEGKVVE